MVSQPANGQGGERRETRDSQHQAHLPLGETQPDPGERERGAGLGLAESLHETGYPNDEDQATIESCEASYGQ